MRILELIRLEEAEDGTLGVLKIDKGVFCFTLELPDRLNEVSRSSIPAQQYRCERIVSPRFGETYEILNVPGRTHILFHPGNKEEDTDGCVLLGESVGKLMGKKAILNSRPTFNKFMKVMDAEGNSHHLTIKEVY